MKAPLSWILDLVDVPAGTTTEEITDRLTLTGLKLEAVVSPGREITGPLVIGRVLTMDPEPQKNGKTINWCTVDVGDANGTGEPQGIVCGAHNFAPGDLVVTVLPGGVLLIPDARLDDGVLDIMALRPEGPFGWLKVWNKIAWENGVLRKSAAGRKIIDLSKDVRSVTYRTGKDLQLVVAEPEEFQLDGDEFGEVTAVHSWVEPGALRVRVPA